MCMDYVVVETMIAGQERPWVCPMQPIVATAAWSALELDELFVLAGGWLV